MSWRYQPSHLLIFSGDDDDSHRNNDNDDDSHKNDDTEDNHKNDYDYD